MTWITPYHQDMDFGRPLSFGDKVTIFAEQVSGWQLDIADACINGGLDVMRHSGFAVLHVILSYFEMIAELKDLKPYGGKGSEGKFNAGVLDVFRGLASVDAKVRDDALKILYVSARCGLYHEGRIRQRVVISGGFQEPLVFCSIERQLGSTLTSLSQRSRHTCRSISLPSKTQAEPICGVALDGVLTG